MQNRLRLHDRAAVPLAVLLLVLLSRPAVEPGRAQQAVPDGLPPLIDRQLFFGDPEISNAQVSPDGRFMAFMRPYEGTRNVWVKRTREPFDEARPVTAETARPIPGYFWSRDGHFILFVQDEGGDENYNVHAVNPAAPPADGRAVPAARNLTDAKGARALIYDVPKTEPDLIYVGLNDRDPAWHDLYRVRISTGERTLLRENTERISQWVFDREGVLRLAVRSAADGDTEVLRVDEDGFTPLYVCTVFETCAPVRFHRDGRRVYMMTNRGADVDLIRLVLLDVRSGREAHVESDPEKRVDLGSTIFSQKTDELVGTVCVDDRRRVHWRDHRFEADYNLLAGKLPDRDILFSATEDDRLWLVTARSDVDPGTSYLFDRGTKALELQYRLREKLPREHLAPMTFVRYRSVDGLEIPACLTLPRGLPSRRLPLIVLPHGGPWARDTWGYDSWAQFLANRGYAVFQPNFRGSAGFGKRFLDAGNAQWGERMQDDITWGVRHLIEQGVADPKRVGILGASYGGYATLADLTSASWNRVVTWLQRVNGLRPVAG